MYRGFNEAAEEAATLLSGFSHLIDQSVGADVSRTETRQFPVRSSTYSYRLRDVPVVVLVDEHTTVAAEIVVAGWQYHGRVTVVGRPTAGEIVNFVGRTLVDGSRLGYHYMNFELLDGSLVGEAGVTPDMRIEGTWWDDLEGDSDPFIEQALELLGGD